MPSAFTRTFVVRWGDMDFNAHMANRAYLDTSADVRMLYFAANGFSMREFERLRLGPVIMRDELDYHRELRLLEEVTVDIVSAGLSDDGSRFRIRNRFYRPDGKLAAAVTSNGGWLNLDARKLEVPPPKIHEMLNALERTDDYEVLPPIGRR